MLSFSLLLGGEFAVSPTHLLFNSSQVSGLLWTSNRRIRKALNRRRSSRRQIYSPFGPTRAESTFGANSSPKPFIFVNNPRSFSAKPHKSSSTSPFIFVNPSPTPTDRPTSLFTHILSRQDSTTVEKSSQNRVSAPKRNPYIIVNPRAEAGGVREVSRKMLRNPNLNAQPRSIPNSYLPMTSNASTLATSGLALSLFYVIYLTS